MEPIRKPAPRVDRSHELSTRLAEERFQLLSIVQNVNGVVSARVLDRKTRRVSRVSLYDRLDTYIVTSIDPSTQSVTMADAGAEMNAITLTVVPGATP